MSDHVGFITLLQYVALEVKSDLDFVLFVFTADFDTMLLWLDRLLRLGVQWNI